MALPTSMVATNREKQTGIILGVHPSTERNFNIELRRSTQSSTASTNWVTELLQPTSGFFTHRVPLPLSTRTFYFQARHTGLGYSAGAYTPVVSAKPVALPLAVTTPITRGKSGDIEAPLANVWLTSAKTIKVGTQATTATKDKSMIVGAYAFHEGTTSTLFNRLGGGLAPSTNAGATTQEFWATFIFPSGVTLTSMRVTGESRSGTSSKVEVTVYKKFRGTIGNTSMFTVTVPNTTHLLQATTGLSSALSQTVSSTQVILARLKLKLRGGAFGSSNARFHTLTWRYRMPDFDDTV